MAERHVGFESPLGQHRLLVSDVDSSLDDRRARADVHQGVGDTGSFDRKSLTMRAVRRICRLREGTDPSPSDAASRRGRCSGVRETDRVCNAMPVKAV